MEEINIDKDSIHKLYIAYGSNLNLNQMKYRCPTARVIGASELKDYELVFRGSRHSAVATIEPCEGSTVPVLLWSIQPKDEKALDRYEGYPSFYGKSGVDITVGNHKATAMVYIMTEGYKLGNPSGNYLRTIEEGYIDAGFDLDILYDAVEKTLSQIENFEEIEKNEPEQGDIFGMKWW
ncbi:gamma-glutamylcyclotransferase [Tissierella pigra]|uniref:Gamma-glutamylcyclotransferase n=1 Tax=Tissierella pigra TaxID=2607614 RepID=A0A6N7Y154_9FIRM|nr:gamma-glutamylcyclotransferase family protein [Tissierella pigra]MBU5426937.1 gamma-glutamylcyclotransferase [Tissierella pigra]MSU03473.1 gamma-glutamylcyclotransferase [Tissierella pigra]